MKKPTKKELLMRSAELELLAAVGRDERIYKMASRLFELFVKEPDFEGGADGAAEEAIACARIFETHWQARNKKA